jgi:hypothetical protein
MFVDPTVVLIFVMYFTLAIPSFLVQEDVKFLLTSRGEKMAFSWFLNGFQ